MVLVCLPSDALSQHLPSYLGFSYLGCGVSLHGCSSKAQPLLLTLDEEYLLMAAPSDLEHGVAPLGSPAPVQPLFLGRGVAPLGHSSQICLHSSRRQMGAASCCQYQSSGSLWSPVEGRKSTLGHFIGRHNSQHEELILQKVSC